jgi:transcriptional regulator with XRE-family HTH domain
MARDGLSKSDLARIAGVTPSAVTTWSRGGHVSPAIVKKLSDHFRTDLTGLISNLIPSKSAIMLAENRAQYGAASPDANVLIAQELRKLADRIAAIEQLLIRVLAEKEKR